jgi:hypothetical protein
MDRCLACGHARAGHWPHEPVLRSEAERSDGRGSFEALFAYIDRLAEAEAEWPADRESVCKVWRCSYYLRATDLTEWKRLAEDGTGP